MGLPPKAARKAGSTSVGYAKAPALCRLQKLPHSALSAPIRSALVTIAAAA
jgi:hypothetical protein